MPLERAIRACEIAGTGAKGVARALEWRPDVVLCDLGLPELNGFGVARALRADPRLSETLLVAVSGYCHEADQQLSRDAGFDFHLPKPVDPVDLQRLIVNTRSGRGAQAR